jgi:hypothetical protein
VITGDAYLGLHHCIVAFDDVAQEMQAKKVRPDSKLYWGTLQAVHLKWECTGIFLAGLSHSYASIKRNGRRNCQYNTILTVGVKMAMELVVIEWRFTGGESNSLASSARQPRE